MMRMRVGLFSTSIVLVELRVPNIAVAMVALRWYSIIRPYLSLKQARLLSSSCARLPVGRRGQWKAKHVSAHQHPARSLLVEAPNTAESLRYETLDNGRMMRFTWGDGETAAFHAVWLRHNCQCPGCLTSSNQKAINPSVVDPTMSIASSGLSG